VLCEVTGLAAGYGSVPVVEAVSFDVVPGRVVALLGPNGAGKTTTLRAMAGLLPPTAGRVLFDGRDLTGARPDEIARAGILLIPEGGGVLRGLTVVENLRLAAWKLGRGREPLDHRVARAFDIFPALADRRHQPAATLSGGERQMLAIGQAVVTGARLLLVDEASLGLAPAMVEVLLAAVAALRAEGRSILLVEQNAAAALEVADQVLVMEKGRIIHAGPAAALGDARELVSYYLGEPGLRGG
jgi:branched-chain amino acid transport system ATP-binding protein